MFKESVTAKFAGGFIKQEYPIAESDHVVIALMDLRDQLGKLVNLAIAVGLGSMT